MCIDIPAHHRREQWRDRAKTDGAGGEVGNIGVLRATGIRLQAAELTQCREIRTIEFAREVLDGMKHGRGVRLDRDLVVAIQVPEPQRRHDPDHRCTRGHVTADLHRKFGVAPTWCRLRSAFAVRMVDHTNSQPQHALLDALEGSDVREIARIEHRRFHSADAN